MLPIAIVLSQYFFGITLFIISTFLILLVLVQRGRGGGLTGALGGPGGQSAFGTKAGTSSPRITVVTAAVWIFMCALGVFWMQQKELPLDDFTSDSTVIGSSGTGAGASGTSSGTETPKTLPAGEGTAPSAPTGSSGSAPSVPAEANASDFPAVGGTTTPASETPAVPASGADVAPSAAPDAGTGAAPAVEAPPSGGDAPASGGTTGSGN